MPSNIIYTAIPDYWNNLLENRFGHSEVKKFPFQVQINGKTLYHLCNNNDLCIISTSPHSILSSQHCKGRALTKLTILTTLSSTFSNDAGTFSLRGSIGIVHNYCLCSFFETFLILVTTPNNMTYHGLRTIRDTSKQLFHEQLNFCHLHNWRRRNSWE